MGRHPWLAAAFARPTLRRRGVLALLMSVLCCLAGEAVAQAAFPGRPGRLVFSAHTPLLDGTDAEADNVVLWGYNPRTRTLRQLTTRGRGCGRDGYWVDGGPAYSPDGRRIAYLHDDYCGDPSRNELRVMDADGSNNRRVATFPDTGGYDPFFAHVTFSPDGRHIALAGLVFEIETGTATEPSLPRDESSARMDWSATGRIAGVGTSGDYGSRIFTAWPDGNEIRWVTSVRGKGSLVAADESPDWSPNARSITFERHWWDTGEYCGEDGCSRPTLSGIWKVSPGKVAVKLRSIRAGSDAQPTFSPSGREIAFMNRRGDMILAMPANGKRLVRPLFRAPRRARPIWSFDWQPLPRR
jgi:Tol biopolymer transport system component